MLDQGLTTISYPDNDNVTRTLLTVDMKQHLNYDDSTISGTFPALNVSWIEFKVKVNTFAQLNKTFVNKAIINFTNPTLEAFGYDTNQSQESASADSPPVTFQWTALANDIRDPGRVSVGTKIVNTPFDLNITIDDSNSSFGQFVSNYSDVNLTIIGIQLVDSNSSSALVIDTLDPSEFTILGDEYVPVSNDMSWLIDKNISVPSAYRQIWFKIRYRAKYKDSGQPGGIATIDSPDFYGPFGDPFATRPEDFLFTATNSFGTTPDGKYLLIKAGQTFDLDVNATDALSDAGTPLYTTQLLASDINDSNNTFSTVAVTDINSCIDDITGQIHLDDFNFTNGVANTLHNVKFDDVGYVTISLRDFNWTSIDITNGDCNNTLNNNDNNQSDRFVSCYIQGEAKILFVPASIEVNTTVTNRGGAFTYMANDLDTMHSTIETNITILNAEGNPTKAFTGGCYADDVNISVELNVTSGDPLNIDLAWKRDIDPGVQYIDDAGIGTEQLRLLILDNNFTDGEAQANILIDANRTVTQEHMPIDLIPLFGSGSIEDYLAIPGADVPETNTTLSATPTVRLWYARVHAPDYRSNTQTINTPIFVEVYCDNDIADCPTFGITGLPESSDDVNWWVNTNHNGPNTGLLFDINATQNGNDDPLIQINGGGNSVTDLNATFTNGRYSPSVTYTGATKLYKTKIWLRPTDWLRYNRFFIDGRISYNVEFNLPADDWSGIGTTGETVETNGSAKSNRRIEW